MRSRRNPKKTPARSTRGLLIGRRGLGRIFSDAFTAPAADPDPPRGYYVRLGRTAMACQFEVFLRPEDQSFVALVHEALDLVDRLEQQMTVYGEDSEISALNRTAYPVPVLVEPQLYQLLRLARDVGRETGGAFDITAGPLIRCWGFLKREGRVPVAEALEAARQASGWDKLVFDDATGSIRFLRQGMELNLGSIGKGYALDRVAEHLRRGGLHDFLVHAGHSSILAAGSTNQGSGWKVGIRDARNPEAGLGSVRLINRSMSTSGIGVQSFTSEGRRYGHLLDPRTGWPGESALGCSVIAPGAARAEALSTAFFVMTREEVQRYCEAHGDIGSIWIAAQADDADNAVCSWGISLELPEVRA